MDGVGALGMATLRELTEILFRVERAHWCYQDDICAQDSALPDLDFQAFATHVFANVPGVELCQACVRREVGRMAGVQVPCCMTCACRGWCQHLALPSRPPNTHACARTHTNTYTHASLSLTQSLPHSLTHSLFLSLSLSLSHDHYLSPFPPRKRRGGASAAPSTRQGRHSRVRCCHFERQPRQVSASARRQVDACFLRLAQGQGLAAGEGPGKIGDWGGERGGG